MSINSITTQIARNRERGSIMIMAAIFMVLIFLMIGMAIDLSRVYMVRAELQNGADAAALSAAKELNGGTTGIDDAIARAQAVLNTHGFAKSGVQVATVSFASTLDQDPYLAAYDSSDPAVNATAAKAVAANIKYVKVTTRPVSMTVLFAVQALGTTNTQSREAVAGISIGLSGFCDFFPAAVGLNDQDPNDSVNGQPVWTPPAPGTVMTLNFSQGTGNSAVVNDHDFVILEVPDINGNGTPETALLTAGLRTYCASLGDNIHMTPSSNQNNGPRNSADGMNTRFGIYANGYGNALQPGPFPPDVVLTQDITGQAYLNSTLPSGTVMNNRRLLVMPFILPGTYPAYTTDIKGWGVFLFRHPAVSPNGNCDPAAGCGSMSVEYIRKAQNGFATGAPNCTTQITAAVLYK